jgi:Flp pilus assembly protein TadG
MRINSFRTFMSAESGVAAIEIAFILPFMFFMFFGLVDITDMVSYNRRITAVASSVGDLVGQNRTYMLKTSTDDYLKVAKLIMKPKSDSDVRVTIYGFRGTKVGSVTTVTQEWKIDNGKGAACSTTPSTTNVPVSLMEAGNDLIVTQACMKYKPLVADLLGTSILGSSLLNIEQTITLRPRSSLTLDCYLTSPTGSTCPKT